MKSKASLNRYKVGKGLLAYEKIKPKFPKTAELVLKPHEGTVLYDPEWVINPEKGKK